MYTAMTKAASAVVLGAAMAEAFAPAAGLSLATPSARLAASSAPPLRGALRRPAATRLLAHVDPASAFHVIDSLQVVLLVVRCVGAHAAFPVRPPSPGGHLAAGRMRLCSSGTSLRGGMSMFASDGFDIDVQSIRHPTT
jgi:hypothetical protein